MTFRDAINKAIASEGGKQEMLAIKLDLSPSSISRKMNENIGWTENEITKILEIAGFEVIEKGRVKALMQTLKVVLNEVEGDLI